MDRPNAVLSVDMEWFSHIPAYRNARGSMTENDVGRSGVELLLELFGNADATSTFFVVAKIAERHPELLSRILESGHEIGSHTYDHVHLTEVDENDRHEQLQASRETLEDATGASVTGFRAPSFDIAEDHFETLDVTGYDYDSSIVPCRSIPGWYGGTHTVQRPVPADQAVDGASSSITELPVAVMPGLRLPLTGTWLRFFGVRYVLWGMRLLSHRGITPILYVHPWELVDLPAVDGVPRRVYWRTGAWMRRAITRILNSRFAFVPMRSLTETD
ncbi:polysaccharide deacetylase family protein [Halocatena salina]|uniref:Polysaccharide deacetylase family protein n=1 Tax=Halocatena salina TaxID=2934340 RepID=A0A8U0A2B0_9EURY|nr:polysaccharide deacetylase family protein [Halocatena salina]UPM42986.1 polysaccharide deacetylase family protein [Halocatena salina]